MATQSSSGEWMPTQSSSGQEVATLSPEWVYGVASRILAKDLEALLAIAETDQEGNSTRLLIAIDAVRASSTSLDPGPLEYDPDNPAWCRARMRHYLDRASELLRSEAIDADSKDTESGASLQDCLIEALFLSIHLPSDTPSQEVALSVPESEGEDRNGHPV